MHWSVSTSATALCVLATIVAVRRRNSDFKKQQQHARKRNNKIKQNQPSCPPTDLITFRPIGYCKSMFPEKWGVPRQGSLAPATRGAIKLHNLMSPESIDGLEKFSHVWLVFIFSQNTNTASEDSYVAGKKNFTFPSKIRPPLLLGKRTGVFSTRSPHRPNPIGLTLAKIVSVDKKTRTVNVSGIDLVDGTPILDIKPFVPADVVEPEDAKFAEWLSVPESPPIVEFREEALQDLQDMLDKKKTKFFKTLEDIKVAIEQVLQLDIRGVPQGRGNSKESRVLKCVVDGVDVASAIHERAATSENMHPFWIEVTGVTLRRKTPVVPAKGKQ